MFPLMSIEREYSKTDVNKVKLKEEILVYMHTSIS